MTKGIVAKHVQKIKNIKEFLLNTRQRDAYTVKIKQNSENVKSNI